MRKKYKNRVTVILPEEGEEMVNGNGYSGKCMKCGINNPMRNAYYCEPCIWTPGWHKKEQSEST